MKNFSFLILLGIVLVGCGWQMNPTHQYLYYISPDFGLDQQASIRYAFYEWEENTNGIVTFTETEVPSGSHIIIVEPADKLEPGVAGYTDVYSEKIQILSSLAIEKYQRVAIHEIGHAIGLEHTERGTAMCNSTSCQSKYITCTDVRQFCNIWNCDASVLPACLRNVK